jgi:nitrite reductase/ring-hydroxylating ferredoxin subunit
MPDDFVKVAQTDELQPGQMKAVDVGADRVLIVNVNGSYHALDDTCSHALAALSEGDIIGEEIQCPLHGATFDIATGEALSPPASEALTLYQVRVEGGDILVGPPESG